MEIINLIQKIKEEAEKLEPSRKEQLLDMTDSYETAVKHLLDPTAEELEKEINGDEDQAMENKQLDEKEAFSRMEDNALSQMIEE